MKFQQIRSATAIVAFGGSRFLIDPWLAPKDSCPPIPGSANPDLRCPIHDLPLPVEEILRVDAVIATHLHFDHFDETAMQAIPKSMPIFAQDETDAETLRAKGFADVRVLKYGGVDFNGTTLLKTDCIAFKLDLAKSRTAANGNLEVFVTNVADYECSIGGCINLEFSIKVRHRSYICTFYLDSGANKRLTILVNNLASNFHSLLLSQR